MIGILVRFTVAKSKDLMNFQELVENNSTKNIRSTLGSSKIRTAWNEDTEEWYFSIVDVIEVLTDSSRPRKY